MRPRSTLAAMGVIAMMGAGLAYGGQPVIRPRENFAPRPPCERDLDRRTRKRLAKKRADFLANERGRAARTDKLARIASARTSEDRDRLAAVERLTNWQRTQWQNETLGTDDPRDYVTLQHWKRAA